MSVLNKEVRLRFGIAYVLPPIRKIRRIIGIMRNGLDEFANSFVIFGIMYEHEALIINTTSSFF